MPIIIDLTLDDDDPPAPPVAPKVTSVLSSGGKTTPVANRNTLERYFVPSPKGTNYTVTKKKREFLNIPTVLDVNAASTNVVSRKPATQPVSAPTSLANKRPLDSLATIATPSNTPNTTTPISSESVKRQRAATPPAADSLTRLVQVASTPTTTTKQSRVVTTYAIQQPSTSNINPQVSPTKLSVTSQQKPVPSAAPVKNMAGAASTKSSSTNVSSKLLDAVREERSNLQRALAEVYNYTSTQGSVTSQVQPKDTTTAKHAPTSKASLPTQQPSEVRHRNVLVGKPRIVSVATPVSQRTSVTTSRDSFSSHHPGPSPSNTSLTNQQAATKASATTKSPVHKMQFMSLTTPVKQPCDSTQSDNLNQSHKPSAPVIKTTLSTQDAMEVSQQRPSTKPQTATSIKVETSKKRKTQEAASPQRKATRTVEYKDDEEEENMSAVDESGGSESDSEYASDGDLDDLRTVWKRTPKRAKDKSERLKKSPTRSPKIAESKTQSTSHANQVTESMVMSSDQPAPSRKKRVSKQPKISTSSAHGAAATESNSAPPTTPKSSAKCAESRNVTVSTSAKVISTRVPAYKISSPLQGFAEMQQFIYSRKMATMKLSEEPRPVNSAQTITNDDVEAFKILGHALGVKHGDATPNDIWCAVSSGLNITQQFCTTLTDILTDKDSLATTIKNVGHVMAVIEDQLRLVNWTPNLDELLLALSRVCRSDAKNEFSDLLCLRLYTIVMCAPLDISRKRCESALSRSNMTVEEFLKRMMKSLSPICQADDLTYKDEQVMILCGWLICLACNYHRGDANPSIQHSHQWRPGGEFNTGSDYLTNLVDITLSTKHVQRWLHLVGRSCNLRDYI